MGAVTLEFVRADRSPFPAELLPECESALMLFCARFYGRNDCVWVEEAGIQDVTCVDLDQEKLETMVTVYPPAWRFVRADAFVENPGRFDLVSVDVFSDQCDQALGMLEHWCSMARKYVLITAMGEPDVEIPAGWKRRDLMHRSDHLGGVYWYILERA